MCGQGRYRPEPGPTAIRHTRPKPIKIVSGESHLTLTARGDVTELLTPINLAITTAETGPNCLQERSIDSTGSIPLSCLIGRGWPSRLT